jgi:uncharacterized protein (TIGR00645 family)
MDIERALGSLIFHSRWLAAPFYIGLALGLALLLVNFVMQFLSLAAGIIHSGESEVILGILGLIDLTFAANLVLIVIFSGYENFVSRIDVGQRTRPIWMAKIDFNGMKQKLMTSIVAISAIQVLKGFMNLAQLDNGKMAWLLGIHAVFLISMLVVVISDRIGEPLEHPTEASEQKSKR